MRKMKGNIVMRSHKILGRGKIKLERKKNPEEDEKWKRQLVPMTFQWKYGSA